MYIPKRFGSSDQQDYYPNQLQAPNLEEKKTFTYIEEGNHLENHQKYQPTQSEIGSDAMISQCKEISSMFTYEENFRVILQGYVNKKTLNSAYQQRYFVLTPTRLLYFTDDSKFQLKGCFNFGSLLKYNLSIVKDELQIKLKVSPQNHSQQFLNRYILQMQFTTKQQRLLWQKHLTIILANLQSTSHITSSPQQQFYPLIPISSLLQTNQKIASQFNHNFWNQFTISMKELQMYGSHLDILLMRSKNPVAYFSRFFMRSHYDHVALILKSQLGEMFVFEAVESRGVSIMDLETYLKDNKEVYEEIGYRRLIVAEQQVKAKGKAQNNTNNNQNLNSQNENKDSYSLCKVSLNKGSQKGKTNSNGLQVQNEIKQQQQVLYKGVNLQKLQKYLNNLLGKRYQLSISKLLVDPPEYQMSKQSSIQQTPRSSPTKAFSFPNPSLQSKEPSINAMVQTNVDVASSNSIKQKSQQTFFCSQLLADIYLKFGIISEGKPKDFWPKDFQQNQIKFKSGVRLSSIMKVCLEE